MKSIKDQLEEINSKLHEYCMGIVSLPKENMKTDVYLYIDDPGKTSHIITRGEEFDYTDDLGYKVIERYGLEFAYDKINREVMINLYSKYQEKIIRAKKFVKETQAEENLKLRLRSFYNYPDYNILFVLGSCEQYIELEEFNNFDVLCLKLVDMIAKARLI